MYPFERDSHKVDIASLANSWNPKEIRMVPQMRWEQRTEGYDQMRIKDLLTMRNESYRKKLCGRKLEDILFSH